MLKLLTLTCILIGIQPIRHNVTLKIVNTNGNVISGTIQIYTLPDSVKIIERQTFKGVNLNIVEGQYLIRIEKCEKSSITVNIDRNKTILVAIDDSCLTL